MTGPAEELARRLLGRLYPERVFIGAIPGWPEVDIPVPEGATVVGSFEQGAPGERDALEVHLDVPGRDEDVVAFFEREFRQRGFQPTQPSAPRGMHGGGFMPAAPGPGGHRRLFCRGEDGPFYSLEVRGRDSPFAVVINWNSGGPGIPNPCSRSDRHRYSPFDEGMPTLVGPEGVAVQGGGGGGSPDGWTTYGSAFTDMPAPSLRDHFAGELERQGWTGVERGASGPAAWGRFRSTTEEGTEAFLFVFEMSPDVRHLTLLTQSPRARRSLRHFGSWSAMARGRALPPRQAP